MIDNLAITVCNYTPKFDDLAAVDALGLACRRDAVFQKVASRSTIRRLFSQGLFIRSFFTAMDRLLPRYQSFKFLIVVEPKLDQGLNQRGAFIDRGAKYFPRF